MTTTVYQPDGTAGKDTFVVSAVEITHGASTYLQINDISKTLIEFDLSGIDPLSNCSSATLSLYTTPGGSGNGQTVTAYSIKSGNSAWTESATWNTMDGSTSWAGSAGCSTSGTDYEAASIGSCVWNDTFTAENQLALTPSVVKTWFGASNSNYGIILTTGTTQTLFSASSDNTDYPSLRPKLSVTYSLSGTIYRRTFSPVGTRVGTRQAIQ